SLLTRLEKRPVCTTLKWTTPAPQNWIPGRGRLRFEYRSADFGSDAKGKRKVAFGVNLRHVGLAVPENDLCGFHAVSLPHFCCERVPQLVRVPVLDTGLDCRFADAVPVGLVRECVTRHPRGFRLAAVYLGRGNLALAVLARGLEPF